MLRTRVWDSIASSVRSHPRRLRSRATWHSLLVLQERLEERIRLPDGRNLGYAEVGDAAGAPLLYFHGNPGSRLDLTPERFDKALRAAGVRLIGTDRPGFGL